MEKKITFLCLGGPKNCMPLRMEKIVEKFKTLIKDPKNEVNLILTGYPAEISYMKEFLNQHGIHDRVNEIPSYDTVSNLKKTQKYWEISDSVVFSTSISHANRVKYIVGENVYQTKFYHLLSGESDVSYAKMAEVLYKYRITRKLLQMLAWVLRIVKMG